MANVVTLAQTGCAIMSACVLSQPLSALSSTISAFDWLITNLYYTWVKLNPFFLSPKLPSVRPQTLVGDNTNKEGLPIWVLFWISIFPVEKWQQK